MPSLYLNGSFYVFGQTVENEDVIESARFDPLKNEWKELGGFNEQRRRFAVVNTNYGVVIVDGEQAKPKLCQISDTSIDCEVMENNDLELTVSNAKTVLFTFDHTQCPKSVIPPAMLLLSTSWRNELKRRKFNFSKHFIRNKKITLVKVTHLNLSARRVNCRLRLISRISSQCSNRAA